MKLKEIQRLRKEETERAIKQVKAIMRDAEFIVWASIVLVLSA